MGRGHVVQRTVIALDGSPRLPGFLAQRSARGFEVFDAVDNRAGQFTHLFDVERFQQRFGREPRPGEIGCTLSHLAVLRAFCEMPGGDGDFLLVAEDDARFVDDFHEVVERVARRVTGPSMVVLADPYGPPGRRDRSWRSASEHFVQLSVMAASFPRRGPRQNVRVGRWSRGLAGASAYLVTRSAATRIIRCLDGEFDGRPWWVADFHGFYRDHVGVDVLAVRPNLAGWEGESSIQDGDHQAWRDGQQEPGRPTLRRLLTVYARRLTMKAASTKFLSLIHI